MIKSIIQHELALTLYNRKTWFCFALLHALLGLIFNWLISDFLKTQATLTNGKFGITEQVVHPYYAWFALIVLVLVPVITTNSICAERKNGTLINYYLAPISPIQVLLGKFLALAITLLLATVSISFLPFSIILSGSIDWGQHCASMLGVYLMLSAAFGVGLIFSSFMRNLLRASVTIFLSIVALIMLEWAVQYTGKHAIFLQSFGLLNPLKSFTAGIISIQHLSYYMLIIFTSLIIGAWAFDRGRYHA